MVTRARTRAAWARTRRCRGLGADEVAELVEQVHGPVVEELARRGSPFVGVLFAGLMLTESGVKVLEFNCRFGDPETQSILPRLEGDFLGALAAAAGGELAGVELAASADAAVTVVLAAGDYPERSDTGSEIAGIEEAEADGALVFHAGTALRGERLVTNGGRILGVTGTGRDDRRGTRAAPTRAVSESPSQGRATARTSRFPRPGERAGGAPPGRGR